MYRAIVELEHEGITIETRYPFECDTLRNVIGGDVYEFQANMKKLFDYIRYKMWTYEQLK